MTDLGDSLSVTSLVNIPDIDREILYIFYEIIFSLSDVGLQQCRQLHALRGVRPQVQTHYQKDCWAVFLQTEKTEKHKRSHHFYF